MDKFQSFTQATVSRQQPSYAERLKEGEKILNKVPRTIISPIGNNDTDKIWSQILDSERNHQNER